MITFRKFTNNVEWEDRVLRLGSSEKLKVIRQILLLNYFCPFTELEKVEHFLCHRRNVFFLLFVSQRQCSFPSESLSCFWDDGECKSILMPFNIREAGFLICHSRGLPLWGLTYPFSIVFAQTSVGGTCMLLANLLNIHICPFWLQLAIFFLLHLPPRNKTWTVDSGAWMELTSMWMWFFNYCFFGLLLPQRLLAFSGLTRMLLLIRWSVDGLQLVS